MADYTVKFDPPADEVDRLTQMLVAAARAAYPGEHRPREWGIFVTDPAAGVQTGGGATGYMVYDWMYVQFFVIPAEQRGQGLGRDLMARVEAFAREHGLTGIFLDTFEFQSRGFYEKLGFTLFGTIEDHPKGLRRFFLQKRLDRSASKTDAH